MFFFHPGLFKLNKVYRSHDGLSLIRSDTLLHFISIVTTLKVHEIQIRCHSKFKRGCRCIHCFTSKI